MVGSRDKLERAVRTVLVTTRAAMRSSDKRGRPDLAMASARRGLLLLDEIAEAIPADASDEGRTVLAEARRELESAARVGEAEPHSSAIGQDSPAPQDVDVHT